ncbi:epidermal differentiation-specific protein-like [Tachysurus fulvidraco]|uniref:epidermal differentiation-specific protein-like n=1 Tax=Tachysurus fulvidraco TaxID=1234273 RepID=UPI001FF02D6A|nr:epidermal differentiation-specific protein-like [Tachysurus fulvidraco]
MNKIIVYEHPDFKGLSREITSDVPDLIKLSFDNCISSLKVIGNPWVAYTGANYTGEPTEYEEGEYASVYYYDDISSLQLVTEDLDNPQITLYEHENYKGRSLVIDCETNLSYGDFDDKASSHKVQRGAWILYQYVQRGGYKLVARAGRDVPKLDWFDNRVSHVRPLKAGKPTIKAEMEWDKMKETLKTVIIDSISGVNYGSEKQTFTTDLTREYSGSVTESFKFSDSTQIGFGAKFKLSLCGCKGETLNVSNTFTVEKGSSNTRSKSESIRVYLPASIPPRTKLTVDVVRNEMTVVIPVKLTITRGSHSKVEYGEYRCEQGISFTTEFKETKIQQSCNNTLDAVL